MTLIDTLLAEYKREEAREPRLSDFICDACGGQGHDGHGRDLVTGSHYACGICRGETVDAAAYGRSHAVWEAHLADLDQRIEDLTVARRAA